MLFSAIKFAGNAPVGAKMLGVLSMFLLSTIVILFLLRVTSSAATGLPTCMLSVQKSQTRRVNTPTSLCICVCVVCVCVCERAREYRR
jgi:hypothetical protein